MKQQHRPQAAGPAPRITVLGGGNGTSAVLRGLARRARAGHAIDITAVVATADDGGSSGRLRQERGGLPPGDLRNCLLALAGDPRDPFTRLFAHRYRGSGELAGHAVGNLVLSALAEREGSYLRALEVAGSLLGACGRVMPVSLDTLRLEAVTNGGGRISGESRIGKSRAIRRVWLDPVESAPAPGVESAIREADLLVCGPGSLFTSILPVLLVPRIAEAVRSCRGKKVLVSNLMTQPGETLGMSLGDHLDALDRHVGPGLLDVIVVHRCGISAERLEPYTRLGSAPVDPRSLGERRERVRSEDIATRAGKVRHDPGRLVEVLFDEAGLPVSAGTGKERSASGRSAWPETRRTAGQ